ncbi:MAG: replicative DNA helicase [Gammaproteobacteria bacterium]|nr:replicative DNA helicase [Gammaproteobacteria bacterium]
MANAITSVEQGRSTDQLKVPPHSVEAEQSVIGGLMLDNSSWDQIADRLGAHDFYRHDHRLIFGAIAALREADKPADAITVSEQLEQSGKLEEAGGMAYIGALAKDAPGSANVRHYADIVRERSVLRQLIRTGNEIASTAHTPEGRTPAEILEFAEQRVFEIAEKGTRAQQGFTGIRKLLTKAVDRIDELFNSDSHITGIPTGLTSFDEKTAGLQPGDLVIVAGRPSMGKTSFAMNMVEHAAIREKVPVAVFSMEMPGDQLALRMISSLGRINQGKVRTGKLDEEDWPRITSAVTLMSEAPIFIDDTPALTPTEMRARARRLKREHGLGMIVVDYLQLMQVAGTKENRATEISEISRGLKALAKELSVPVIALSQLNRGLEQRPDKRPIMSDLRESGAIEQDADLIVFIYRDEVYNEESPFKGTAEVIIGKQRNGPIGMVRAAFLGQFTRFENLASDAFMGDAPDA